MIELVRHIEALLLENDCVIVPQFGGFVAHYSSAKWVGKENIYLPPTRTIGFNPQLKINDGLLVQSYMQSYNTDFPDAAKRIEKAVKELTQKLRTEGELELHGMGILSCGIDNIYKFHPNQDGVATPELYGLSSFEIGELKDKKYSGKEKMIAVEREHTKNVYEIRINRAFLRHTVAAAVAIIAFFLMSTPVENTYVETDNYAELLSLSMFNADFQSVKPVRTSASASTIKKQKNALHPKAIKEEKIDKTGNISSVSKESLSTAGITNHGKYNIIVASVNNKKEAETVIKKYHQDGYADTSIIEGDGRTRISLMSFSNRKEAYKKLNEIKQIPSFKDAWLLIK